MKMQITPLTPAERTVARTLVIDEFCRRIDRLRTYIELLEDGYQPEDRQDMRFAAGIAPGDLEDVF